MKKVDQELLSRLRKKLRVGRRQVYNLIAREVQETHLPRHLAAISLASTHGINISRFVSEDDLATIRSAVGPARVQVNQATLTGRRKGKTSKISSLEGIYVDPFVDDRVVNAAHKNAELYPVVYVFENSVRRFVAAVMQKEFGPRWWEDKVNDKIKKTVEIRRGEEKEYPWHCRRGAEPVYYTDIRDLRKIIGTHAQVFGRFGRIGRIELWIEEIEKTRNTLAHNNPVAKKDRNRIVVYARDWSDFARSVSNRLSASQVLPAA